MVQDAVGFLASSSRFGVSQTCARIGPSLAFASQSSVSLRASFLRRAFQNFMLYGWACSLRWWRCLRASPCTLGLTEHNAETEKNRVQGRVVGIADFLHMAA